jgi:hypothetical protein
MQALVGRLGGKRQTGRPRSVWKDHMKMDEKELGGDSLHWIEQA